MFSFDVVSVIMIVVTVIGAAFLTSAVGAGSSKFHPLVLAVIGFLFGLAIWIGVVYFSTVLSQIEFVGYFLYLFKLLSPFGLLIYGSSLVTAASCLIFVIELTLIAGYVPQRLRYIQARATQRA